LFLGCMIAASIQLMKRIDVVRGKANAERWSSEREIREEQTEIEVE